jgi:hypothetical protein
VSAVFGALERLRDPADKLAQGALAKVLGAWTPEEAGSPPAALLENRIEVLLQAIREQNDLREVSRLSQQS